MKRRGKNKRIDLEEESALLSNERTLLSYMRTTFAALIFGFALIQLSKENTTMLNVGIATIIGGIILGIIGFIEYRLHKKRIKFEVEG
ncbi:DUF202 domain-containing protein [Candidatus Pacearchaeota archaeon]|nr:DUF202 domain-containing protein [Candidatus Pacearchaeota archaeon]